MKSKWIKHLSRISGLDSAVLVDDEGLVISSVVAADDGAELTASLAALMLDKITRKLGSQLLKDWIWTECETDDSVIMIKNMGIGILVLKAKPSADSTLIRTETSKIYQEIIQSLNFDNHLSSGR